MGEEGTGPLQKREELLREPLRADGREIESLQVFKEHLLREPLRADGRAIAYQDEHLPVKPHFEVDGSEGAKHWQTSGANVHVSQTKYDQPEGSRANNEFEHFLSKVEQSIIQGISSLSPLPKKSCIFKVHQGLRHVNPDAYTPVLVSIGPYHHGNSKYLAMEQHKKRYLESFLKRRNQRSVSEYLQAMMVLGQRALNCYADPVNLEPVQFIQMMLLDASFVIEFLRKCCQEDLRDEDDPIFGASWIRIQIYRDLIMLENQLPFFVLLELFNMSQTSTSPIPFANLAQAPILQVLPKDDYFPPLSLSSTSKSMHFLDLVHNIYVPPSFSRYQAYENKIDVSINADTMVKMPCAMDLDEAGVEFQVNEGEKISVFDVSFEDGVLKIPKFEVSDSTELFLRNIIAYEQHVSDEKPKYFTDFTSFMDSLINTKDDVKKLCSHQIIANHLGDDEEVAHMFNKLGKGRMVDPRSFYYSQVCKKLNDHCRKWQNKARAKLMHDYFNSPWAVVSTFAATFLLLLTLTQTVASLIPLLGSKGK